MADASDEGLSRRLHALASATGDDASVSQRKMLAAAALRTGEGQQPRLQLATQIARLWRHVQDETAQNQMPSGASGSESASPAEDGEEAQGVASNDTSLHLSFAAAALALLQPDTRSGADTRAIGPAFAGGSGTSSTAADAASAVVDVSRGMLVPMLGLRSLAAHVPELSQELAALLLQRHQWAFTAGL
eukprot:CAMPEP_0206143320 /NCGR_PEP_ID=MMETSP1473-20131121/20120_1 /ASSEMBLY_ACC=CAM_ASM_001109 /TAXON_ID=1461547 /ORGANISM="Stichococcus sp, Strain RCC1054" /LENGTH=188 /DNA_ID=CAMNT_0053538661 /DNA_START=286 /DNA_END=848 /DNA_ORIENTATION=+